MARKVFLLAVMGGAYPQGKECNLMGGMSNEHNHLVASAASSKSERFSLNPPQSRARVLDGKPEFWARIDAAQPEARAQQ